MKTTSLLIAAFLIVFTINAQSTKWEFDLSHSNIRFNVSHMMISEVEGQFNKYSGNVFSDKEDFSDAKINFIIDVSSIDTENENRDKHLQGADFFNVEKYPEITFESTSMEKVNDGNYLLTGNFTMMGVTKSISLEVNFKGKVKDRRGNIKAGFKVTGVIDRTLFGLTYNSTMDTGGLVLGEDVEIVCNIQLIKSE